MDPRLGGFLFLYGSFDSSFIHQPTYIFENSVGFGCGGAVTTKMASGLNPAQLQALALAQASAESIEADSIELAAIRVATMLSVCRALACDSEPDFSFVLCNRRQTWTSWSTSARGPQRRRRRSRLGSKPQCRCSSTTFARASSSSACTLRRAWPKKSLFIVYIVCPLDPQTELAFQGC